MVSKRSVKHPAKVCNTSITSSNLVGAFLKPESFSGFFVIYSKIKFVHDKFV